MSRTMPPLPIAARPTSNCGLTRNTPQAPGAASARAGGSARRSEMKLTSATTAPTGSAISAAVRSRAFRPAWLTTRGSAASRGWSWSWPTSTAWTRRRAPLEQDLGEAAGRGADIDRDKAFGAVAEMVEPGDQLEGAARHITPGRIVDCDRRIGRHDHRRLRRRQPVHRRHGREGWRRVLWLASARGRARPAQGRGEATYRGEPDRGAASSRCGRPGTSPQAPPKPLTPSQPPPFRGRGPCGDGADSAEPVLARTAQTRPSP